MLEYVVYVEKLPSLREEKKIVIRIGVRLTRRV